MKRHAGGKQGDADACVQVDTACNQYGGTLQQVEIAAGLAAAEAISEIIPDHAD